MRANVAKQRLKAGKVIIGPLIQTDSPTLVEYSAYAGFDFVLLDCEHGPMSIQSLENMVRAAEATGITPLARVPHNEPSTILRFLDTGIMGLLVPHIETPEQAVAAVSAVKYPPEGERGLAGIRAADYGATSSLTDYMREANEQTMVMALVESKKGVENTTAIAAVPGVDLIQIGPSDLANSLGYYGQSSHPAVAEAVQKIVDTATAAGVPTGRGAIRGAAAIQKALDAGIRCITLGSADLYIEAGRQLLADLKR